jgi:hypothetical protein
LIEKKKYVFIIGAGASIPYNFPSGYDLFHIIKTEVVKYAKEYIKDPPPCVSINTELVLGEATQFSSALSSIDGISIDKYININKKYERIGVRSILSAIIRRELTMHLPINRRDITDNWYSYLFQKMIEGLNTADELLEIYKNKVSFITFNYDRSLEEYLYLNFCGLLKNSGKLNEEITESIRKIEVIHVYGQAGLLPWQAEVNQKELILDYGNYKRSSFENADRVISLIEVMYSKRESSATITRIKEIINMADRILFLGFGYDDDNLKILGFPIDYGKEIMGTALHKTSNEILHNENKLFRNPVTSNHARSLVDCNSTALLRDYLV